MKHLLIALLLGLIGSASIVNGATMPGREYTVSRSLLLLLFSIMIINNTNTLISSSLSLLQRGWNMRHRWDARQVEPLTTNAQLEWNA